MNLQEEIKLNKDIIKYLKFEDLIPDNIEDLSDRQKSDYLKNTRRTGNIIHVVECLVSELDAYGYSVGLNCHAGKHFATFEVFGEYNEVGDSFNSVLVKIISRLIQEVNDGEFQLASYEH